MPVGQMERGRRTSLPHAVRAWTHRLPASPLRTKRRRKGDPANHLRFPISSSPYTRHLSVPRCCLHALSPTINNSLRIPTTANRPQFHASPSRPKAAPTLRADTDQVRLRPQVPLTANLAKSVEMQVDERGLNENHAGHTLLQVSINPCISHSPPFCLLSVDSLRRM